MPYSQYLKRDNKYQFSGPFEKLDVLPAGVYTLHRDEWGNVYIKDGRIITDNLLEMKNSPAKSINKKVDDFLKPEVKEAFDRYQMLYKRGILLYGPPGTGKTSVVNLVIKTAVKKGMIVFINPAPRDVCDATIYIRTVEKSSRPILVVWEEFESMLDEYEIDLLDLLDGVDQVDNAFYIATTNYIDKIPSRIKNRPSRFAEVVEIGPPNAALRKSYLEAKISKEDKVNIDEWVEKTEGFVIDHLKDLIISVLVLKVPLDEAIEKIRMLNAENENEEDTANDGEKDLNVAVASPKSRG